MTRNSLLLLTASMIFFGACGKKDAGGNNTTPTSNDDFKKVMLTNYADNLIIPAYADLDGKLSELEVTVNAFLAAPSGTTLEAVRTPFITAYLRYETTSAVYFGPAAALLLNSTINTFPCVPAKIEAGIQSGIYNLTLPVASDSIQGFPALDYLLFSPNALAKYPDANRKKYVQDVVSRMRTLVTNTLSQWNTSYRTIFVNSLKTDVGSSIGFLVNQFAFEMDALKGPRIGWPFGKQSNGIVFADKCEGYYSGISIRLASANLASLKNYFTGGTTGNGIDDYLVLLKKEPLKDAVLTQFQAAQDALKAIPDPLSVAFTNNAPLVEETYRQVQKLLTMIKTDVSSATGVQITYMDNDGD